MSRIEELRDQALKSQPKYELFDKENQPKVEIQEDWEEVDVTDAKEEEKQDPFDTRLYYYDKNKVLRRKMRFDENYKLIYDGVYDEKGEMVYYSRVDTDKYGCKYLGKYWIRNGKEYMSTQLYPKDEESVILYDKNGRWNYRLTKRFESGNAENIRGYEETILLKDDETGKRAGVYRTFSGAKKLISCEYD